MNMDDYKVTIPYPKRPSKPILPNRRTPTAEEARLYAFQMEGYEREMAVYREAEKAYRLAQMAADARFKVDVLREHGLEGHPKADGVFMMAWDEGHSNGLSCVEEWVLKLSELVVNDKPITVATFRAAMVASATENQFILQNIPGEVYAGAMIRVGLA